MRIALFALVTLTSLNAYADKPVDRARAFVTSQLAAITKEDDAAAKATFAADAIVLGLDSTTPIAAKELPGFKDGLLANLGPHSFFKKAALKSIVAGGNDKAIWLTAEIVTTYDQNEPEEKERHNVTQLTRLTELVANDASAWKAVAALWTTPSATSGNYHPKHLMIGNTTKPGSLAALAASPAELTKQLSADKNVFVLGTDTNERAIGPAAAKKLLAGWTKLGMKIDTASVREVATKTYGFAQVSVSYSTPDKDDAKRTLYFNMQALVIALPDGSGGSKVVAVHYAIDD